MALQEPEPMMGVETILSDFCINLCACDGDFIVDADGDVNGDIDDDVNVNVDGNVHGMSMAKLMVM